MSADRKEKLETPATEETRELYLKDGRRVSVDDNNIVEIRAASGQVEVRIQLTEQGPVLQMEAARMQLKAAESLEIESKRVDIKVTEGDLKITGEADMKVEAKGEVRINGKMIWLN